MKSKKSIGNYLHSYGGYSLLEVLIVCALIASTLIPVLIGWRTSRSNQALKTSAESFSNDLRSAHIYAREAKNSQSWGLKQVDPNSYQLVSGNKDDSTIESPMALESQINFVNENFEVWFDIGTGETNDKQSIELENMIGKRIKIDIHKTGLIEMSGIY